MSVGVLNQAVIYRDNFQLPVFTCPPLSASIGRLKMDKSLDRGGRGGQWHGFSIGYQI
jgi:hypothetical protein